MMYFHPSHQETRTLVETTSREVAESRQDEEKPEQELYCGVCQGVLKIKHEGDDDSPGYDQALSTCDSGETCPLPSSDSAVGISHPCGHLFHVSCFHNHNIKLHNRNLQDSNEKESQTNKTIVEIYEDCGGSSVVEIVNSDDSNDKHNQKYDECPTCHQPVETFTELNNPLMHHHHISEREGIPCLNEPKPQQAIVTTKLLPTTASFCNKPLSMDVGLSPNDTSTSCDDADTDIMNYYSFTNTDVGEDLLFGISNSGQGNILGTISNTSASDLFVDTTNVMAKNLAMMRMAHQATAMIKSEGYNASTSSSDDKEDDQENKQRHHISSGVNNENDLRQNLNFFADENVRSTSSIDDDNMVDSLSSGGGSGVDSSLNQSQNTGSYQSLVVAKQLSQCTTASHELQFFDSRATPATPSIMITPGNGLRPKANKRVRFFDDHQIGHNSLLSMSLEDEEAEMFRDQNPTISYPDDNTIEDPVVVIGDDDVRDDNGSSSRDESNSPNEALSTLTDDSQEDNILNYTHGLDLLPKYADKNLLWNVSSCEDDAASEELRQAVSTLQTEIESMRSQLFAAEKEKEAAKRVATLTRTRELDTISEQNKEIHKLKKKIHDLEDNQDRKLKEMVSTEEELATTQLQLETTIDSHQQVQQKLQEELNEANDEIEELRFQLETCKEEMEQQTRAATAEKDALIADQKELEEEMKQEYNAKLKLIQEKLEQAQKEAEEAKSEAERAKEEMAERLKTVTLEQDAVVASLKEVEEGIKQEYQTKLEQAMHETESERASKEEAMSELQSVQQELQVTRTELEETEAINLEETEEMNAVRRELETTKDGMEKLLAIMQDSEKELVSLRDELNIAKEALAATTHATELERTNTSTSLSTLDNHSVQSLQAELQLVKRELAAKNAFIQGQLNMAKGKLIEYVRTKEGELETAKQELAMTKKKLKEKNGSITDQLQSTEEELKELASMKETLLKTMHDLAERNSIITEELDEAKKQLEVLAETKEELKGTKQALSASNVKLWSTFAMVAVFVGHWISGYSSKSRFFLKQKAVDSNQVVMLANEFESDFD